MRDEIAIPIEHIDEKLIWKLYEIREYAKEKHILIGFYVDPYDKILWIYPPQIIEGIIIQFLPIILAFMFFFILAAKSPKLLILSPFAFIVAIIMAYTIFLFYKIHWVFLLFVILAYVGFVLLAMKGIET